MNPLPSIGEEAGASLKAAKKRDRQPPLGLSIRKSQVIESTGIAAISNRPTVD